MSLPASIRGFLRARDRLSEICSMEPWGTVTRNGAFPRVHDANHACVFDAVTPTLDEVRAAIAPLQRVVAALYTHVEVVDTASRPALMSALSTWLGPPRDVFSLMVTAAPPQLGTAPGMLVAEQPFPPRQRWLELIAAAHADETPLPDGVLEELADRDGALFAAAGTRFFTVSMEGGVVAYTSLMSLDRVGLIDNVATLPVHRRRGAGTSAVAAAVTASAAAGNTATFLFTHEGSNAQRLYSRLGMRVIAQAAQFRRDEAAG